MDPIVILITALVAWIIHIYLYNYYARRASSITTRGFIAKHCLEAAVIFGAVYWIGFQFMNEVTITDLLIAGGATAVLDLVVFLLFRDYFRPIVSNLNLLLPPIFAGFVVIAVFLAQ